MNITEDDVGRKFKSCSNDIFEIINFFVNDSNGDKIILIRKNETLRKDLTVENFPHFFKGYKCQWLD